MQGVASQNHVKKYKNIKYTTFLIKFYYFN
jgi:hypothetical protein